MTDPSTESLLSTADAISTTGDGNQGREDTDETLPERCEYVASISYELRTPMSGILGMASLLLGTALDDEQREYVETIQGAADSLLALLNEILELSKLEAGRLEIEHVPFDLYHVCDEVVRMLRTQAERVGSALQFNYSEQTPRHLVGDPHRIRQILMNLVGSALKLSRAKSVRLAVECVSREADSAWMRIRIEDIDPETHTPRRQTISPSTVLPPEGSSPKRSGTGLDMAISRRLVNLIDGQLLVRSEIGEGTAYWVELELKLDPRWQEPSPRLDSPASVLLVLADAQRRAQWLSILDGRRIGVDIVSSADAAMEALEQARRGRAEYQAIIVDYHLPDLDGETLGRTLSSRIRDQRTAIFLIPPAGMDFDADRLGRSGYCAALTTPEELDPLQKHLDTRTVTPVPTLRSAPESARAEREHHPGSTPPPRVLVVEDNPVNQKVVMHMLRKQGFDVALAEDGARGVEMLMEGNYDLVLMDCQMPIMDGYEATQRIRAIGHEKGRTPIVALTANAMDGDRDKCLAAGMDDYLSKPAKANQLGDTLRKWIPNCGERLLDPQR